MRILAAACMLAAIVLPGAGARAQEDAKAGIGPRLYLTGKATREAPPDFASVTIGVGNKAATTAAAMDATSAAAARIVTSARQARIEPRDIQTSYVSLQPAFRSVREAGGSSEQRPDGYTATNSVTVRLRDLGRLGEFLRVVVDGGANRIDGISFELADPAKLEREAVADAVRDARRQAETIAEAAGVRLGRIEEIRYGARSVPDVRQRAYRAAPAPAPPVPVEAGTLDVSAEIEVVFALDRG